MHSESLKAEMQASWHRSVNHRVICVVATVMLGYILLLNGFAVHTPVVCLSDDGDGGAPLVSAAEILRLHERFVKKPAAYFETWTTLAAATQPSAHSWRWPGKDYPRVPCVMEFESYVRKHKLSSRKLLIGSKSDPELAFLPHERVDELRYDVKTETGDLHTFRLPDTDFDFAIISQTLEHLYDPLMCMQNVRRHLMPGGYLFVSVPTFNKPHSTPVHFMHFMPDGLALLLHRSNYDIVELGQWGNIDYAAKLMQTNEWPDINQLAVPILNMERFPVITWALARKPLPGKMVRNTLDW